MWEYLRKGSKVLISGSMRTRKWQDKDGNDKSTTEIVADKMLMLDGKQERSEPQDSNEDSYEAQKPASRGSDFEDDIPFMRIQNEYAN